MSTEPIRRDRRHDRRDETIREIVDVAAAVMGEQGAGGLSLGEVARRMGMQTPSLYVYFPSKNAVYDAVFAEGWVRLLAVLRADRPAVEAHDDVGELLLAAARSYVRWSVEHPAYTQLMAWRPVPGWTPSPDAYGPAVETWAEGLDLFTRLRSDGRLRADVEPELLLSAWTVLVSGVVTQQLANAPEETFEHGRYTNLLPDIVGMFVHQYGAPVRKPRAAKGRRSS
jgi:AcrR family transcriptional regulator